MKKPITIILSLMMALALAVGDVSAAKKKVFLTTKETSYYYEKGKKHKRSVTTMSYTKAGFMKKRTSTYYSDGKVSEKKIGTYKYKGSLCKGSTETTYNNKGKKTYYLKLAYQYDKKKNVKKVSEAYYTYYDENGNLKTKARKTYSVSTTYSNKYSGKRLVQSTLKYSYAKYRSQVIHYNKLGLISCVEHYDADNNKKYGTEKYKYTYYNKKKGTVKKITIKTGTNTTTYTYSKKGQLTKWVSKDSYKYSGGESGKYSTTNNYSKGMMTRYIYESVSTFHPEVEIDNEPIMIQKTDVFDNPLYYDSEYNETTEDTGNAVLVQKTDDDGCPLYYDEDGYETTDDYHWGYSTKLKTEKEYNDHKLTNKYYKKGKKKGMLKSTLEKSRYRNEKGKITSYKNIYYTTYKQKAYQMDVVPDYKSSFGKVRITVG